MESGFPLVGASVPCSGGAEGRPRTILELSQLARSQPIFHSSTLSGFEPGECIRMVAGVGFEPTTFGL